MGTILNSIDFLITTKSNSVLLIKRDAEPEKNKLALPGGVQIEFESFEATILRLMKLKLGVIAKLNEGLISIGDKNFPFKQSKTYDSGPDVRGGNTTVFSIETDFSENELKSIIPKEIYFFSEGKHEPLAFDHNKFISDYFFEHKNYTFANIQNIGITVDIVMLTVKNGLLRILLNKRSKDPFKGYYTLPGGFVTHDKSLNTAANEMLERDTNIKGAYLEQLYTFGDVGRDSRGRIITVAYYALIDYSKFNIVFSGKYDDVGWFSLDEIKKLKIGFDHKDILDVAIDRIKNKIEYTNIVFQLLPEKFTLAELQEVYETILEKPIDKRNFRKKIAELDMLEELNEYKKVGRMRPAQYHRFKERSKETVFKVRKWI